MYGLCCLINLHVYNLDHYSKQSHLRYGKMVYFRKYMILLL